MKDIIAYIIGVIVCSGVLTTVYSLLLERRVRFSVCRAYLPIAMVLAAVIPAVKIPVWEGKVLYMEAPQVSVDETLVAAEIIPDKVTITPEAICLWIYLVGAALVAGAIAAQLVRMRRLRGNAVAAEFDGFKLLRVNEKIASFSFFNTIFVSADTSPDDLQIILAHETGHIRHRHSAERVAMELLKAAMWWNPFVWIAARRLTEVQEYEADSDVLANGYDVTNYINTLLKHLFGYSPDIANGLRDSLTKKRLKMMTIKKDGRYALLRLAAVVPIVGALITAFSFTAKATQVIYTSAEQANPMVIIDGQKAADGALDELSPEAIESITVLKDASAKSSYAYLGDTSDGIIIVQTKEAAAKGEKITVSGTVLDTGTVPVAGATVAVVSSTVKASVVTDKNGTFTLQNVPESANITASYIGMESATLHYTKANAHNLTFILAPEGKEVVETEVKGVVVINSQVLDADTGKTSEKNPLIIVDGEETASLSGINPDAIESMEVLKDKTAIKRYGERAKDGVIIVKRKKDVPTATDGSTSEIKVISVATAKKSDLYEYDQPTVIFAQKMPQFEGGDLTDFRQWVMSRIRFPQEALENNKYGRIVASFVIDTEGKLGDINILASPDEAFSNEVRRVLAMSPAWTPGEEEGKAVSVKFTMPVDFAVRTDDKILKDETEAPKSNIQSITVLRYGK